MGKVNEGINKIVLFGVFFLLIIYILIIWWNKKHVMVFSLNSNHMIRLTANECVTCFMDWPIEYKLEVWDFKNNKLNQFEFWTGNGPYLNFRISETKPSIIIIDSYAEDLCWVVNLTENTIDDSVIMADTTGFKIVSTINNKFEVIKR